MGKDGPGDMEKTPNTNRTPASHLRAWTSPSQEPCIPFIWDRFFFFKQNSINDTEFPKIRQLTLVNILHIIILKVVVQITQFSHEKEDQTIRH